MGLSDVWRAKRLPFCPIDSPFNHQNSYCGSVLDGKMYKTLKRHLSTRGYTPNSYREAFGLPADYPIVAPDYSAVRYAQAKEIGLG